ncbi:MAG: hypothetical protein AAB614_02865 [Patescibacteria group bacterium]
MNELNIKVQELILSNEKKSSGCETFVYEPSNIEENGLGNLYIIGWIKSRENDLEFLPNLVASIAKREFYKLPDTQNENRFESCLKKVNIALAEIDNEHKNIARNISFCIINSIKNEIKFSLIGEHFIYLLRKDSIINISDSNEKNKKFSRVVTGNLEAQDKYIFATSKFADILSQKSIKKILGDAIEKQAEIIKKIYDSESSEIPLPPQAALLFEISSGKNQKSEKNVFGRKKNINTVAGQLLRYEEEEYNTTKKKDKKIISQYLSLIMRFVKKKKVFIGISLALIIIITLVSFYVNIRKAQNLIIDADKKIEMADKILFENKDQAFNILNEASNISLKISSYPFFTKKAMILKERINKKMDEINGIFNISSLQGFGKISGRSFDFNPKFILESNNDVYVFSDFLDAVYKIKSGDSSGSFLFLNEENFEVEKVLKKDDKFFFLNYIREEARFFDPNDNKIYKVEAEKELRNLLKEKPSRYNQEFEKINYSLDTNQIIKTQKEKSDKYINFLSLIKIRDFTISSNGQYVYVLSEREVFRTENK